MQIYGFKDDHAEHDPAQASSWGRCCGARKGTSSARTLKIRHSQMRSIRPLRRVVFSMVILKTVYLHQDTGLMLNWDKRPYDGKRENNLAITLDANIRF